MSRNRLAVALALALLAAGCVGSQDSDGEAVEPNDETEPAGETDASEEEAVDDTGSNATTEGTEDANETDGPPPINRTYEDSGAAGVVLYDPGQTLGAKIAFAKQSYDNGLNGTWVLGYEVQPAEGHELLKVETSAEPVDPLGEIPEYDLFVFDPNGEVVASSFTSGSNEEATVSDVGSETYLALLYYQQGADNPIETHVLVE